MKFSIIVPVHNAEKTLERCLQSILKQNTVDIEILLIENGSVDSSYDICQEYSTKYDNVFSYRSKQGVSAARNLGLTCATGNIIGFCDSDDEFVDGAMAHVADAFRNNEDVACVVGGYNRVTAASTSYMGDKKSHICSVKKVFNRAIYDFNIMGSVWNKFFKREYLEGHRFDEALAYCEDTHFLISVLSECQENTAYILNESVYCYIANEQSVTNNMATLFNTSGQLKYVDALDKILELSTLNGYTRAIIGRQILWLSIEWYPFATNEAQRNVLRKNILSNIWNYLRCIYLAPQQIPRTSLVALRRCLKRKSDI